MCFLLNLLLFNSVLSSEELLYRSYDRYHSGAGYVAQGTTGVSNAETISALLYNPAILVIFDEFQATFNLDTLLYWNDIDSILGLKLQYIPLLAFSMPLTPNSAIGLSVYTPFQRKRSNFFQYDMAINYAYSITSEWSLAVSVGPSFGIQTNEYDGWGYFVALSSLLYTSWGNIGVLFRRSATLSYEVFLDGLSLKEKMPDILRIGISKAWYDVPFIGKLLHLAYVRLTIELEYLFWQYSYFKRENVNITPNFETSYMSFLHPHIGLEVKFRKFLKGLSFSTGLFTEDFFDDRGYNSTQILWSIGVGGYAGRTYLTRRVRIQLAYVSSNVFAIVYRDSKRIDQIHVTLEYSHL